MKKFIKTSLTIITALYISCGIATATTPAELYDDVWKIVNKKFYDPSNNSQDWYKWRYRYDHKLKTVEDAYVAIDTMLASLNDPYTRFLPPKEFSEETQSIKGSLKGIGQEVPYRNRQQIHEQCSRQGDLQQDLRQEKGGAEFQRSRERIDGSLQKNGGKQDGSAHRNRT